MLIGAMKACAWVCWEVHLQGPVDFVFVCVVGSWWGCIRYFVLRISSILMAGRIALCGINYEGNNRGSFYTLQVFGWNALV